MTGIQLSPARAHGTGATPRVRPRGRTKATYVNTVVRALRILGATPTATEAYRLLADHTPNEAWTEGGASPVNYKLQTELANTQQISERQWRRLERQLEEWGAIERTTTDNGYRGRHRGADGAIQLGISLQPSIDNIARFEGIVAEQEFHRDQYREALWLARATRRRVRDKIAALPSVAAASFERRLDEIDAMCPPGTSRQVDTDTLTSFRLALCSLEEALDDDGGTTEDNQSLSTYMSAAPDTDVRCYIQPTTETYSVSCNEPRTLEQTPGKPGDDNTVTPTPNGVGRGLENKDRTADGSGKANLPPNLTFAKLKAIASEDFEMYLDAFQQPEEATVAYLRELGISIQAWEAAVDQMGWPDAFVSLVIIDRNRFHPNNPVRSPGGALRKFTELHRAGRLSLMRSIIGIWERDRAGTQPRARRAYEN